MRPDPKPSAPRAPRIAASFVRFPRHALALAALAAVTGSAFRAPVTAPVVARATSQAAVGVSAPAAIVQPASPRVAVAPESQADASADADPDGDDGQGEEEPQLEPIPVVPAAAPELLAVSERTTVTPPPLHDDQLRAQLHWLPVNVGSRKLATLDVPSRLALAQAAAERAGLRAVGLDFRDLYGVIQAETSWVPRTGMGRNGVASHGLAQLEPATARALGVRNPNDPVEAVQAAARLLRDAAAWSARRIAGLQLSATERAQRLREGVSVYYNLSTRARERWTGRATDPLPVETLRHIRNVRAGAMEAQRLLSGHGIDVQAAAASVAASLPTAEPPPIQRATRRATAVARATTPTPLGTIAWSSRPGEQDVVWSNGSVTRSTDPVSGHTRVHWTSAGARG
jgi:hypothetical protein